jgi:probable rRNA maturation factor
MKPDPLITYRRKPASLDLSQLESFAEILRTRVARGREFHCRITNDEELSSLNARFRKKDYPTDVLSFPYRPAPYRAATVKERLPNPPLGDIAISLDRARAQAKEWNHSTEDELRILLLHGVLHLTGLDHETDSGRMHRAELRWRRKLGLPASLIERALIERAQPERKQLNRTQR